MRLGSKRDIDIGDRSHGLPANQKVWRGLIVRDHHLMLLGFIIANHRNIALVEPKPARMNGAEDITEHILVFEDDLVGVIYDERDGFEWPPARAVSNLHDITFGNRNVDYDREVLGLGPR
jgi:hypothetical protein